jgi:hypothetical protein
MLKTESEEAKDKPTKDAQQDDARTGARLLVLAYNLLASEQPSALNFATTSLSCPATLQLPMFLYKLAEANKSEADHFYQQALAAYLNSSMDQFLYLSSYPFGNNREAGEMPSWTYYQIPGNFAPNPTLQRLFIQTLLCRAQQMIENPGDQSTGSRFSDGEQVWLALTRLAPQIDQSLPDLGGTARQMRDNLFAILNQGSRAKVTDTATERPKKTFDELVDDADRSQIRPVVKLRSRSPFWRQV